MKKKVKNQRRVRQDSKLLSFINTELKTIIKSEASTLGVTPNEYLRIAIGIAKNIREGFGDGQEQDVRQLLSIIQNPLFVFLLRTVADSFLKQPGSTTSSEEIAGNGLTGKQVQVVNPQQSRYPATWEFW